MTELLSILKSLGFTTAGSYGIWTGVLLFLGYLTKEWRETRKLSADDRLARRDGYAKQVENLQKENRDLRSDVNGLEDRHQKYREWCEAQHDKDRLLIRELRDENDTARATDRAMIRALQDELTGIKRAMAAGQVAAMEALPPAIVPVAVKAMSDRVGEILRDQYRGSDETKL